jgi:arginase family enzyme
MHLDLDGAWPAEKLTIPTLDLRRLGPRLRYITRDADVRDFSRELPDETVRFFLYGSGDFHHLSAALVLRAAATANRPIRVVCFDNHPDWDIRPPRWACGAWVNRALESTAVERLSVWGCGNFEMDRPHRWFRNRHAIAGGRLEIFPWTERQSPIAARCFPGVCRTDWRDKFEQFAAQQSSALVYVTVDMDCLREEDAATDWEAGLLSATDVAWAIDRLRNQTTLISGDVCGATSLPAYARNFQRFAGWWDHPAQKAIDRERATEKNIRAFRTIWPALAGLDR